MGRVFREYVERLDSIPGIVTRMAEQILAEIGTNICTQFPVQCTRF
jgi:transposase